MVNHKLTIQDSPSRRIVVKTLTSKVTETIRDMITSGECERGSRLFEVNFSQMFGVSRTCVREAFITLENEGLIVSTPNKSTSVKVFTKKNVEDLYELRAAVETVCLERSMKNSLLDIDILYALSKAIADTYQRDRTEWFKDDLRFHEFLLECSDNM